MNLNNLDEIFNKFISKYPKEDLEKLKSILRNALLNEGGSKGIYFLVEEEWQMLEKIKQRLKSEIGLLKQTDPLPLSLFNKNDGYGFILFFFYLVCFQFAHNEGITITTNGREFNQLDNDEKSVLYFLLLLVMRTRVSQIKIINSPQSITDFYEKDRSGGNGGDDDDDDKYTDTNKNIFYGICDLFGYPVVKNRNLNEYSVQLEVKKLNGEVIVIEKKKKKQQQEDQNINNDQTAGFFFTAADLDVCLGIVNDYQTLSAAWKMKLEETGHIIGGGAFGSVRKAKFTVLSKYNNNNPDNSNNSSPSSTSSVFAGGGGGGGGSSGSVENFWSGNVAIKTVTTKITCDNLIKPSYNGSDVLLNTEIYTWLGLHKNQYVHPEDFEIYTKLSLSERHGRATFRSRPELPEHIKLPGNMSHGILPIHFIYITANDIGDLCINFVCPLMIGSLMDFSYVSTRGSYANLKHRVRDQSHDGYFEICESLLLDMLGGFDSMHNNTEHNGAGLKSFMHGDFKPDNCLWTLTHQKLTGGGTLDKDDFIALISDFGQSVQLTNAARARTYKITAETVDVNKFFALNFKSRTLRRIQLGDFGGEITHKLDHGKAFVNDDTRDIRLMFGFSQVADFQSMALTYLFLLSGFMNDTTTDGQMINTFLRSTNMYSYRNILGLLVGNDNLQLNPFRTHDSVYATSAYTCSHISKEMVLVSDMISIHPFENHFIHMKNDVTKYIFMLFLPFSNRPFRYFERIFMSSPTTTTN